MKEIYDWVPMVSRVGTKTSRNEWRSISDRQSEARSQWGENPPLLRYGDAAIDPFSFFYFLASKAKSKRNKQIYDSVSHLFDIESPLRDMGIEEYNIFPTPRQNMLFHGGGRFSPDLLWHLFRQAAEENPDINPEDFKKVMGIKNVAVVKLTHTLFLINPGYFQPVDNITDDLSEALDLRRPSELQREINKSGDFEEYHIFLQKLNGAFPGCKPHEINMFLYLHGSGKIQVSDRFYQISTFVFDPKGGDYWDNGADSFEENNWVYTGGPGPGKSWDEDGSYPLTKPARGDIILVRTGRQRGRAIGIVHKNDYVKSGMNENSRIHVLWINKTEERLSRFTPIVGFSKAGDSTHQAFEKTDGYKPTFDLIKGLAPKSNGYKPQLHPDALQPGKRTMKNPHPLNQILYGPPGTSKTWNSVDYALSIIEDMPVSDLMSEDRTEKRRRFNELKKNRQIEMVTFPPELQLRGFH